MLSVQKDELSDDVIYYLSRNVRKIEIKYAHVDKLALVAIHAIQIFRHYILLPKPIVIFDYSLMAYIMGKYSKWIFMLKNLI